jgi:hypothetical protein
MEKVLTILVGLREEVAIFLDEKSDSEKSLRDEEFIPKLAYLADIFSKLNELNLYLQGTEGADIFAVHDKIRGFIKKLVLWKKNIEDSKYDCFETFETFIIENDVKLADGIITEISAHLNALKKNFDCYFLEEIKKLSAEESVSGRHDDWDIDKGRRITDRSVRRHIIRAEF